MTLVLRIVIVVLASMFLALFAIFFSDTLLIQDGSYIYAQMREILLLNTWDPLHFRYQYCGVLAQLPQALLGFIMPYPWATMLGTAAYFVLGFFLVRKAFPSERRNALLSLILLPLPCILAWFYGSGGDYVAMAMYFFLCIYVLSSQHMRTSSGALRKRAFMLLGFFGGLAVYSYLLSKVILIAIVLVGILNEWICSSGVSKRQRLRDFAKQAGVGAVITILYYKLGMLPYYLPMYLNRVAHESANPTLLDFTLKHLLQRFEVFVMTMSYMFSPILEFKIDQSGGFDHFTHPILDFISNNNSFGTVIGIMLCLAFAFLSLRQLLRSRGRDQINNFFLLLFIGFFSVFLIREETVGLQDEVRFLSTFYFVLLLGILLLAPKPLAFATTAFMLGLAVFNYTKIIHGNYVFLQSQFEQTSCNSVTRDQLFDLLMKLRPAAVAGKYRDVFPIAVMTGVSTVYDASKSKFYFHEEAFARTPFIYFDSWNKTGGLKKIVKRFPERSTNPGKERTFTKTRLAHLNVYFEDMDGDEWRTFLADRGLVGAGWPDVIDAEVRRYGKLACHYRTYRAN